MGIFHSRPKKETNTPKELSKRARKNKTKQFFKLLKQANKLKKEGTPEDFIKCMLKLRNIASHFPEVQKEHKEQQEELEKLSKEDAKNLINFLDPEIFSKKIRTEILKKTIEKYKSEIGNTPYKLLFLCTHNAEQNQNSYNQKRQELINSLDDNPMFSERGEQDLYAAMAIPSEPKQDLSIDVNILAPLKKNEHGLAAFLPEPLARGKKKKNKTLFQRISNAIAKDGRESKNRKKYKHLDSTTLNLIFTLPPENFHQAILKELETEKETEESEDISNEEILVEYIKEHNPDINIELSTISLLATDSASEASYNPPLSPPPESLNEESSPPESLVAPEVSNKSPNETSNNFSEKELNSLLWLSCWLGDLKTIKQVLNKGCELNQVMHKEGALFGLKSLTPIGLAAKCGHREVVEYLLTRISKEKHLNKNTPLITMAARYSDLDVVKFLIERHQAFSDVKIEDSLGLVTTAAKKGHLEIVEYLLNKIGENYHKDYQEAHPLIKAVLCRNMAATKLLIRKGHHDPNETKLNGYTPLMIAAWINDPELTKYLQTKEDSNNRDTYGRTLLMLAAQNGSTRVVEHLMPKMGWACLGETDNYGHTPLILAAKEGHLETIQTLIKNGARSQIKQADKYGQYPLQYAIQNGHTNVTEYLLTEMTSSLFFQGSHPLIHAIYHNELGAIKHLIENGSHNPNLIDEKTGFTPLALAARYGNQDIMGYLIKKDANIHQATRGGNTPLNIASTYGQTETVNYLNRIINYKQGNTAFSTDIQMGAY